MKANKRRTEAQIRSDYRAAIEHIKLETLRPTPMVLGISKLAKRFNVRGELFPVMVNLGLLKQDDKSKYQWDYGDGLLTDALIDTIYNGVQAKAHKKRESTDVAAEPTNTNKPSQGKSTKANTRVEKPKINYQGTLFNLKQLSFMSKQIFNKPATIMVDNNITLEKVDELTFEVKDSDLIVRAIRIIDRETRGEGTHSTESIQDTICVLNYKNCGLALRYGYEDTKVQTLVVESVPL